MIKIDIYKLWSMPEEKRFEHVESLIAENRKLQEHIRKLERQTVVLASHLSKYVMHTMSTKEWLEWSEKVAKENE